MVRSTRPAPNARQSRGQGIARGAGKKEHSNKKLGILGGIKKKARKVGKGIVKGAKVASAAAQLAARMTNPVGQARMAAGVARGKGLTLPGSNYIGPGNPMNRKIKSKGDALAKQHDKDYERYLKAGYSKKNVYSKFSDADARLMKKSNVTTPEGIATYAGMAAKKALHKTGLTGKKLKDENMEKREKAQQDRKLQQQFRNRMAANPTMHAMIKSKS